MNNFYLNKENLEDFELFRESGYSFAEHVDETSCNLRDIVADIVAKMLWRQVHPEDNQKDFYEEVSEILHSWEKFQFHLINWDNDDENDENLPKIDI